MIGSSENVSDEGDDRMIDTDKYEGHTEGPWICDACYENGIIVAGKEGEEQRVTIVQSKYLDPTPADDYDDISFEEAVANIHLISDAPLLLEEVKKLRAFIDKLYAKDPSFVDSVWEEGDPQRDDWGEVKRLRKQVELLEWAEKTHPAYLNNLKKGFKGYKNE